jgi:hypothetical protein
MRLRDVGILAQLWWIPVIGVCCIASAVTIHLTHTRSDSAFELALLGIGGACTARGERAFHRTRNKARNPTDEFLSPKDDA